MTIVILISSLYSFSSSYDDGSWMYLLLLVIMMSFHSYRCSYYSRTLITIFCLLFTHLFFLHLVFLYLIPTFNYCYFMLLFSSLCSSSSSSSSAVASPSCSSSFSSCCLVLWTERLVIIMNVIILYCSMVTCWDLQYICYVSQYFPSPKESFTRAPSLVVSKYISSFKVGPKT